MSEEKRPPTLDPPSVSTEQSRDTQETSRNTDVQQSRNTESSIHKVNDDNNVRTGEEKSPHIVNVNRDNNVRTGEEKSPHIVNRDNNVRKLPNVKWFSLREVALAVGVDDKTVRNWKRRGVFVPAKEDHDGRLFYSREQVEQLQSVYHKDWNKVFEQSLKADAEECETVESAMPAPTPLAPTTVPFTAPSALRNVPRWVLHKNKVPHSFSVDAKSPRLYKIDPTKSGVNFLTFDQAVKALEIFKGKVDGLGFALDKTVAPIVCIDIDGLENPYINTIFEKLLDTYIETSPSGKGYHVWYIDNDLGGISGRRIEGLEIYAAKRYMTYTGRRMVGMKSELAIHDGLTRQLLFELFDNEHADRSVDYASIDFNKSPNIPDENLLGAIKTSNDIILKGLLFDGNISGYKSHSEADWHCILKLCFWTGGNAGQIERLFYLSPLADREKWQEREDYRRRTIARALLAWDNQSFTPAKVNEAPAEFRVEIEGQEYSFRQPKGYFVDINKGIYKFEAAEEDDDTGKKIICNDVILPLRSVINADNDMCSVELAFKRDNGWKRKTLSNSALATNRDIIELSNLGLDVTSLNARKLISFFSAFRAVNRDRIKKVYAYAQIGWRNENFFAYPVETKDYILDVGGEVNILKDFTPTGDRELWLQTYNGFKQNKYFRMAVAAALAAPLLKILQLRNMTIMMWSKSGSGKTAILKFADSVYKNPMPLFKFRASNSAIEARCVDMCDLPLCIDELKTAELDKKLRATVEVFSHLIESGASKGRATIQAEAMEVKKFRTIALITGEEPLTAFNTDMGIKRRTLELHCESIFPKETVRRERTNAEYIHVLSEENYALVGQEWIKLISNSNMQADIIEKYQYFRNKVLEMRPDAFEDHCKLLAACATADYFFNEKIADEGNEPDSDVILDIDREFSAEAEEKDTTRVFKYIADWLTQNQGYFVDENETVNNERTVKYGWILDKGKPEETIAIIPSVLRQALTNAGFNPTKAFTELALEHLIETQYQTGRNKPDYSVVKWIKGVGSKRAIVIRQEVLSRITK